MSAFDDYQWIPVAGYADRFVGAHQIVEVQMQMEARSKAETYSITARLTDGSTVKLHCGPQDECKSILERFIKHFGGPWKVK